MSAARRISPTPNVGATLTTEQESFLAVRTLATDYASGYRVALHRHPWHQLLFASSGAMTVSEARSSWMIPTAHAVFIPARRMHAIRMWGTVEMRTLYFAPQLTSFGEVSGTAECRVIEVAPLLRELILRTVERAGLDARVTPDKWMIALLEYEVLAGIAVAESSPLALPLPADERALAVAHYILGQPCDAGASGHSVDQLARQHGLTRRTLERRFRHETGISIGMWRQKARLLDSIRMLAEGKSVTNAALDSGYSSVSAFIAAFKRTFGYTPGACNNSHREVTLH